MLGRIGQFVFLGALVVSPPATAAEVWDCTIHDELVPGATEVSPGHVQIKIDGDDLAWIEFPITNPRTGKQIPEPTSHYHLAVNNDVGAVAIFAQARTSHPSVTTTGLPRDLTAAINSRLSAAVPRLLVNSFTVVLNKQDGSLRTGAVDTREVSDMSHGECQQQSTLVPTNPPNPK